MSSNRLDGMLELSIPGQSDRLDRFGDLSISDKSDRLDRLPELAISDLGINLGAIDRLGPAVAQMRLSELPPRGSTDYIRLADLEKVERLGEGQFGCVYKVRDKRTGEVYALKEVKNQDNTKAIEEEVSINMAMWCDQIVRCYQVYHGDYVSLLMEHMDAGTLTDLLKVKQRLDEGDIAAIAIQVLKGLHYLHRERVPHVAHRDIKPSNLLLKFDHEVKIGDFGVSAVLEKTLENRMTFAGTASYLPPERVPQFSDPKGGFPAEPGDIWSLGITLLQSAIGQFPYKVRVRHGQLDHFQLISSIVNGPAPRAPESCSPEFRHFIECCLTKDCNRRAGAKELLQHPFLVKHEFHRLDLQCLKQQQ
eukprot:TRINITY_DN3434_c0_g1_i1.p1 TRINITY_DN3434_c0_g1~~TRINITY_DN3434_c0_g1_i1.p1  ORF type:complete len:363 (+),score=85.95 TRINITY_DN3434_c0_g1_i1:68-1156(+)